MELISAIENRRSIRRYKPDPVDRELLKKLAQNAAMAPNNGNSQPWKFIFVDDSSKKENLVKILGQVHAEYFGSARKDSLEGERLEKTVAMYERMSAPVFLVLITKKVNNQLGEKYSHSENSWNHHSCAAAMENLMLSAVALGLGTCWLATPTWREEDILELLGVPQGYELVALTPIGYPDESPRQRPRKPVEDIVSFNGFDRD